MYNNYTCIIVNFASRNGHIYSLVVNPPPTHSHTQVLLHKQVGSNNLSIHDLQGAVIIHLPFNGLTYILHHLNEVCVSECSGL